MKLVYDPNMAFEYDPEKCTELRDFFLMNVKDMQSFLSDIAYGIFMNQGQWGLYTFSSNEEKVAYTERLEPLRHMLHVIASVKGKRMRKAMWVTDFLPMWNSFLDDYGLEYVTLDVRDAFEFVQQHALTKRREKIVNDLPEHYQFTPEEAHDYVMGVQRWIRSG